ncbi:MAG: hypothetical protein P4L60_15175 [Clostridium sp.]|nr:hypothetical protein [Clostridium sp.]
MNIESEKMLHDSLIDAFSKSMMYLITRNKELTEELAKHVLWSRHGKITCIFEDEVEKEDEAEE